MIFHAWYLRNCTPAPTSHVSQHMFVLLRTHQQCRRPLVHQLSGRAAVRQLQQLHACLGGLRLGGATGGSAVAREGDVLLGRAVSWCPSTRDLRPENWKVHESMDDVIAIATYCQMPHNTPSPCVQLSSSYKCLHKLRK